MDDDTNLSLFRLFHQCSHRMRNAEKYRGQGRLLILLLERGRLTQRELAQITGRRSATLSEQLENMEKAGYVTREKNDEDRRNVDVVLTPLGAETAGDAKAARAELADRLFASLSGRKSGNCRRR
jgi:DNA-binding MarR family transcriptional regulator